ncbi:MAG: hypothetical protein ACJAWS_001366 [Oleiphilaceae bacterium]|jgi:hypothetical protein
MEGNMDWTVKPLIQMFTSRWVIYPLLVVLLYPLTETAVYSMMSMNGFVIDQPLIPESEIHQGGPPRDGIPSIDDPVFVSLDKASFLKDDDRVLGVSFNGVSKAYSLSILNYHELVNDVFNKHPVVVSFCPLCGTGMAFDALNDGKKREFGVSGLLYNSDLLMYDRQTDSLWSQIEGRAISGSAKGQRLKRLAVTHTSWKSWRDHHPNTLVLSQQTGHQRNYLRSPYPDYSNNDAIYFPVSHTDKRYHPKEVVVGVEIDGKFKAYPFVELAKGTRVLEDMFQGEKLIIEYYAEARSAKVMNESKVELPSLTAFWFAWVAFHPESNVYKYIK